MSACSTNRLRRANSSTALSLGGFPQWVGNGHRRHNPIRTHRQGNWCHGTHMHNRNARPFNFFDHRCAATSTGPSGTGENDSLNTVIDQFPGNFRSKFLRIGHRRSIAYRGVKVRVQFGNLAFALQGAQGVNGNDPIRCCVGIGWVITAVGGLESVGGELV